jgi:hypothetical protein
VGLWGLAPVGDPEAVSCRSGSGDPPGDVGKAASPGLPVYTNEDSETVDRKLTGL